MTKIVCSLLISLFILISNANAVLTVTSPNSGESFLGCTVQEISWSENTFRINLYYSLDGGASWRPIAKNISGGYPYKYAWTVPQVNSTQCLIKVEDYINPDTKYDISDTPFSITSTTNASLQLISPSGGEQWGMASKKTIRWNTIGSISKVRIEHSRDNGNTWMVIDSLAENTGSYPWIIPTNYGANSTSLIRISDYVNSCITDYSNSFFSLVEEPNLTLTNPNRGEKIFSSTIKNITWARSNLPTPFVSLDYSLDSGKTWNVISRAENNFGTFAWIVPDTASEQCMIKIYCSTDPRIADTTGAFSIIKPSLAITKPTGNQNISRCGKLTIDWTSDGTSPYVNIHYSTNGGKTWNVVVNSVYNKTGNNSFEWLVPAITAPRCVLKISDVYSPDVYDLSENFSISGGLSNYIDLAYPLGGDSLKTGDNTTIRWTGAGVSETVTIAYSEDAGLNWRAIATVPNTGSYDWTVPNAPSSGYLMKVSDPYNLCLMDISDSVFDVEAVPHYTITFPNTATDTIYPGIRQTIRWTSGNNPSSSVGLYYSLDSGATWNTITTFANNNGSYNWTVPDTLASHCLIKVVNSLTNPNRIEDVSDQAFPIGKPQTRVVYPNGGELFDGCVPIDISWTSLGNSSAVNLYYSLDAGNTWNQIGTGGISNVNGLNTYKWTPPGISSRDCFIKVADNRNTSYAGQSDNPFSIAKTDTNYIRIVYPAGGETWGASRSETVSWNSSGGISHVDISYSTNNGLSWQIISSNTPNTGSYNWTVPDIVSSQYLIRVKDNKNACVEAITSAPVNVIALPAIKIITLNNKEVVKSGRQVDIYWTNHFLDTSRLKIEYSVDSAKTWKLVESSIKKSQRYTWDIPYESSSNCFIKVSQVDNPDVFDINDVPFSIIKPSLKLLYPLGGEQLAGCTPVSVQWEGQPAGSSVNIYYSVDHGKTWSLIGGKTIPVTTKPEIYTHNWTIPAIESSGFRIKIEDISNTMIKDSSVESFSVNYSGNHINVTSPVDNENLGIASSKTITWTNTGTISYVNLSYSVNGGKSWFSIANAVPNTGSYVWTVPTTVSSDYKLMIQDYQKPCVVGFTNQTFNVVHQDYITVSWNTSFNEIRWISNSLSTTLVNIDFSSDSMKTWTRVASEVVNNGRYVYITPNLTSDYCFFRVSSSIDPMYYGINQIPLIIRKYFTLTSPLGGEQLTGCESIPITWNSNGNVPVSIYFSSDNGANWRHIVSVNSRNGANTYNWQPLNLDSDQCLIQLVHRSADNIHETSATPFSIHKNGNDLSLITPNGNEVVGTSDKMEVRWETTGTIDKVKGYYSTNGGQLWNPLFSFSINNTGSYLWVVPNRSSENYVIRITNDAECIETVSDEFTVIDRPHFSITSPIGGEEYYSYQRNTIRWSHHDVDADSVAVEFSSDSGETWSAIYEKIINLGNVVWNVPDINTTNALIRIKDIRGDEVYDQSGVFTIVRKQIRLITQNNAESLTACSKQRVSWTRTYVDRFNLAYSSDNGLTWKPIVSSFSSYADTSHYDWTIPADYSDKCLIRIEDAFFPDVRDTSDQTFTISRPTDPSLELLSPGGGEIYKAATDKLIVWNTTGTVNNVNLRYSTDNGSTWTSIVTQANAGSYRWRLPSVSSDNYIVSVSDAQNACVSDHSQRPFTIVSIPTLSVTSPKLGDILYSHTTYPVTVVKSSDATSYYLEYSTDSLKTWERIYIPYYGANYTFTAPEIESSNCFIRANFGNFYGISERFSIMKPTIEITTQKGGESLLGCHRYTINWTTKGTKGKTDLYYSVDNGQNWKLIEAGITDRNYYDWWVPAVISNQCRIKVVCPESRVEALNAGAFRINNGVTSLELVSPNGGERIIAGVKDTILWENTGQILNVDLKYSLDNGASWINLVNNIPNSGSYVWTVPAKTSTEALFRISDNYNTCVSDVSNLPFSVEPALSLIYPNGNEKLFGCSAIDILWSSEGGARYVSLQYSTDGGKIWNDIQPSATNKPGINSYTWNTANVNTSQCLVRVMDIANKAIFDESDAVFSVEKNNFSTITLTSPNGGEYWGTGKTRDITWESTNTSDKVNIEYTTNEGQTWYTIAGGVPNTKSYAWRVPNIVSSRVVVKLRDYVQSCVTDQSDAAFNIIPAPFINVYTFNSFEKVYSGKTKSLSWTSGHLVSNKVSLQYSTDSARTWKNIVQGYTLGNSYTWTIPDDVSNACFIKVFSTDDPSAFDINRVAFTIARPHITLQNPDGGEVWAACSQQRITWTSEQATASVRISHSADDGLTWNEIGIGTYGSIGYVWTIPSANLTGKHRIRVQDYSQPPLFDISENYFTIVDNPATLTLTSLNGGQLLKGNDTTLISWNNTGIINSVRLSYSLNGGISWKSIGDNIPNSGEYKWRVPNSESSESVKIRVEDNGGCAKVISASNLAIEVVPEIIIYYPSAGELLGVGSEEYIVWFAENYPSRYVNIDYTLDEGVTWTNIKTQSPAGLECLWVIPNEPYRQGRIRIRDYYDPSIEVISPIPFTIVPVELYLTESYGGRTLTSCTQKTISWYSSMVNSVDLFFSADNGASWESIGKTRVQWGGGLINEFEWSIPSLDSDECRIKVQGEYDSSIVDISDVFSIRNNFTPSLKIISPAAGDRWPSNSVQDIAWESDTTVKYVDLYFSSAQEGRWNSITKGFKNTGKISWPVPASLQSGNTRIAIIDIENSCDTDTSGIFHISGNAVITVLSPNGGEKLVSGSRFPIMWNSAFIEDRIKLEYTMDRGAHWILVSDTLPNTGGYDWIVPMAQSNSVQIRISDANNDQIFDVSNNVFSINPPTLMVTRPNGGEFWYGNTMKSIFWSASNIGSSYVKLEYSLDSAKTWLVISEKEENDGVYNWQLPNSGSVNCFVKVSDIHNPEVYDISDSVFTMVKPAFTILYPNGNESLKACSDNTITWTGQSGGKLYYSTNGGATWENVGGGLVSSYSSLWSIPEISSTNCLIKIVDSNDPSIFDVSDAPFTVTNHKPRLELTSPNGGEEWQTGRNKTITWDASEEISFVKVEIAYGNSWNYGSIRYNEPIPNTGSVDWTVFDKPGSAFIRISDRNSCASDASDASFTIAPAPYITITSPDKIVQVVSGTTMDIQWSKGYLSGNSVDLSYSTDGGDSWTLIQEAVTSASYSWSVPYTYSDNCLIKVEDAGDPAVFDISRHKFTIVRPAISGVRLEKSEYDACTKTSIFWSGNSRYVNLYFSADSGATWHSIEKNARANPYHWTVPRVSSTKCFIKITDPGDESIHSIGDFMFAIKNPDRQIEFTNSFEEFRTGSLKTISWSGSEGVNGVALDYSIDNGSTWQRVNEVWNAGSYNWLVPNTPTSNAVFRISDLNSCATDESPSFSIESVPYILVQNPQGGENWDAGSSREIRWTTGNMASSVVNIQYSIDSGSTWNTIGTTAANSFLWIVPNSSSARVFVKVSSAANPLVYGVNEKPITLSSPGISLMSPNGGEKLTACTNSQVRWTSNGVEAVYLYYSTDNGVSWIRIYQYPISLYNYYSWSLPELSTEKALLKVVDANDPTVFDISDSVFAIQNVNTNAGLTLLSPNGDEILETYGEKVITWNTIGDIPYVQLSYSTLGGLTWKNITTVPNTGAYTWKIPDEPTLSGLFRIKDINSCVGDESNGQFAIKSTPYLKITTPEGGENYSQSSAVYVYGQADNLNTAGIKLEFSSDSGKTWSLIEDLIELSFFRSFSYKWIVPDLTSSTCYLKISDPFDPDIFHISGMFQISPANSVWPGDTDNNGIVDVYDMFPIGLHYGATGPARESISIDWAPYFASEWNRLQSNDLDLKYVDCDGDGMVYYQDTLAVRKNYGFARDNQFNLRVAAVENPNLYFIIPEHPYPGEVTRIEIWAGSDTDPLDNLYGIAFKVEYAAEAVEANSVRLSLLDNWLGDLGIEAIGFQKGSEAMGRIDGAIIRIDHKDQSGYGKIADLYMKLKPNMPGFKLKFSGSRAIASDGTPVDLYSDDAMIDMTITAVLKEKATLSAEVYPNPSSGVITVSTGLPDAYDISINNFRGETVWRKASQRGKARLDLNELPKGVYFVKIEHEKGSIVKKLILL